MGQKIMITIKKNMGREKVKAYLLVSYPNKGSCHFARKSGEGGD